MSGPKTCTISKRSDASDGFFTGRIDDLQFYNTSALTAANMSELFSGVQEGATYYCTATGSGFTRGKAYIVAVENTGLTEIAVL